MRRSFESSGSAFGTHRVAQILAFLVIVYFVGREVVPNLYQQGEETMNTITGYLSDESSAQTTSLSNGIGSDPVVAQAYDEQMAGYSESAVNLDDVAIQRP